MIAKRINVVNFILNDVNIYSQNIKIYILLLFNDTFEGFNWYQNL